MGKINFLRPPREDGVSWKTLWCKIQGVLLQGPIHHGKSLVISSAGPGWRPPPRVSTPNENPVQASIWLAEPMFPAALCCVWGLHCPEHCGYGEEIGMCTGECRSWSKRSSGNKEHKREGTRLRILSFQDFVCLQWLRPPSQIIFFSG